MFGGSARGDGRTRDTAAIQAAIDVSSGAGRVVFFPPGDYRSGTLRLRHGTAIELARGAALIASGDDDDFDPPARRDFNTFADEETSDLTFALLQGRGVRDVRIFGPGRIDGNRSKRGGPKPIALTSCTNVEIRDVTVANAGNYAISLLGCEEVNVEDVIVVNGQADGIDPDCCRRVHIARCRVETRDDAICLKSSLSLGVRRATEYVRVEGCELSTLHNALKLGTESSGDFRHIAISDCTVTGRRHPWIGNMTSGISLQAVDGAVLERVSVWNVRMAGVRAPIFVRQGRRGRGQPVPTAGALRDVSIRDVTATDALLASSVTGVPGAPVERVSLANIRVTTRSSGASDPPSLNIPEMERRYPDAYMFDDLPAYGLYCRHVSGLTVEDVQLAYDRPDTRSPVVLDDVDGARVRGLTAMTPERNGPLIWANAVRNGQFHDIRARDGGRTIARVSGSETTQMEVARQDARQIVVVDSDVRATALRVEDPSPAARRTTIQ